MKWNVFGALALAANCVAAQTAQNIAPPTVPEICGSLGYSEHKPTAGNSFREGSTVLRRVPMHLYVAGDGRKCCAGLTLAAQTTTSNSGSFHLGATSLALGRYWIFVKAHGRPYRLLIQYDPKTKPEQPCEQTSWWLDDRGGFWKQQAEPPY
jgi:hypothetical protein